MFKFKKEEGIALIELILAILIFVVVFNIVINYENSNLYINPKVDKNSEWYVNDLYLSDQFYYKKVLDDEERILYKQVFNSIKNIDKETVYYCDTSKMLKVMHAIICDHPELINLAGFSYTNSTIRYNYLNNNQDELNQKVKKIQSEIYKVSKEIKNMQSEYEKEKYIYEWLGKKSRYGQNINNSDQSAFTAFADNQKTVCSGFAKAAQILLQNFGIDSHLIIGGNHIWNIVKIDNEYYFFDATCTWVKNELNIVSYSGLNQNKKTSNYTSQFFKFFPEILGSKYNYFDYEGKTIEYNENNLDDIKKIINESDSKKVEIKINNYSDFLKDSDLVKNELNIKSFGRYGGYLSGSDVIIIEKN